MAVKMKGPKGNSGFGYRGETFEPDEGGVIDVPHAAIEEAFSHGFELADQDEDDGGSTEINLAKMTKAQIVQHAADHLGLALDPELTKDKMIAEVEKAAQAKAEAAGA